MPFFQLHSTAKISIVRRFVNFFYASANGHFYPQFGT